MNVRLTKEQKIKVLNSNDVYEVMQSILMRENKIGRNKEHFWIVGLDTNYRILFIELISLGTINATLVEPMEVFSLAISKRAVNIMMVHNHPDGELTPSHADKEITDKMLAIGKFLEIQVIDHLIISEDDYYSFMNEGLLAEIEKNTVLDLSFANIDSLKNEIKESKNEAAKEIAIKLKSKGMSTEDISETTGLTKKQIEKL
ncbi:JAB domain-containing protein [Fulvivirgaceae bacterium BMA12]|uniref:JAB domain-containing protein n=1 Tax=Agaribacillus aureus TaxID=3051825 RepID=A0ABT8L5Z5_9BACT|nr:JAB domain-containing protein [Fulvivirgaceae bacterium BMA12]